MGKSQVIEKKKSQVVEETIVESVPTCQHHWVIESPRGSMSKGHCKRCGEEREFRNSTSDYVWDDDSGKGGYNPWRGNRPSKVAQDDEMAAAAPSERGTIALV